MANPTDNAAPPPASMGRTPGITPGGLVPQPDNGAPPDTRVGTIPGDTTLNPIQEFRQAGRRPSMVSAPQGPDIRGHDPVLFTDIEGMYLARLYPGHFADANNAAAELALEDGRRAQEDGQHLVADQQNPVNWDGEGGPRPTDGPGPAGEQAGRPWNEQEALRRDREVRRQQQAQQHPHEPPPGETDEQRQQREQRERNNPPPGKEA